tara:strand:- start:92 stop:304 length:213 start_codon:yes stop_codon:yes gene_type:complete
MFYDVMYLMSSSHKFEHHSEPKAESYKHTVKLTDLLSRLNVEKKKERNTNIAFSVAAVSAIAAFGIILSI